MVGLCIRLMEAILLEVLWDRMAGPSYLPEALLAAIHLASLPEVVLNRVWEQTTREVDGMIIYNQLFVTNTLTTITSPDECILPSWESPNRLRPFLRFYRSLTSYRPTSCFLGGNCSCYEGVDLFHP